MKRSALERFIDGSCEGCCPCQPGGVQYAAGVFRSDRELWMTRELWEDGGDSKSQSIKIETLAAAGSDLLEQGSKFEFLRVGCDSATGGPCV